VGIFLAHDQVKGSLRANDLAGGRDQRDIAHIPAHAGNFGHQPVEDIIPPHGAELGLQVGKHTAGDLGIKDAVIVIGIAQFLEHCAGKRQGSFHVLRDGRADQPEDFLDLVAVDIFKHHRAVILAMIGNVGF